MKRRYFLISMNIYTFSKLEDENIFKLKQNVVQFFHIIEKYYLYVKVDKKRMGYLKK